MASIIFAHYCTTSCSPALPNSFYRMSHGRNLRHKFNIKLRSVLGCRAREKSERSILLWKVSSQISTPQKSSENRSIFPNVSHTQLRSSWVYCFGNLPAQLSTRKEQTQHLWILFLRIIFGNWCDDPRNGENFTRKETLERDLWAIRREERTRNDKMSPLIIASTQKEHPLSLFQGYCQH